jgi:hypothetical protein
MSRIQCYSGAKLRLTLRPCEPARVEIEVAGLNAVHADSRKRVDGIAEGIELAFGVSPEHLVLIHQVLIPSGQREAALIVIQTTEKRRELPDQTRPNVEKNRGSSCVRFTIGCDAQDYVPDRKDGTLYHFGQRLSQRKVRSRTAGIAVAEAPSDHLAKLLLNLFNGGVLMSKTPSITWLSPLYAMMRYSPTRVITL